MNNSKASGYLGCYGERSAANCMSLRYFVAAKFKMFGCFLDGFRIVRSVPKEIFDLIGSMRERNEPGGCGAHVNR